jgi:predicted phage terminase large subunit-like protein
VYFAVGIGGPATGLGADVLLVDDPIKNREEAQSETIRSRNKDWYTAVANTRLMPGGAVIIISTRWHSDDLSGWLLKEHADEGWNVVSLPALAEEKEFWRIGPLTWTREIGDALWPEWYDKDALAAKRRMSSRDWNALFQQRPVEIGGNMCKLDWFGRYSARPKCGKITLSIDAGQKGGANNDPTVVLVMGETQEGHVVLDMWRDRAIYPRLVPKIVEMIRQWWPTAVLIEDKASGINLLQDLGCTELANRIPMIGINPDGDKVTRFDRVTPIIEKGKVILPAPDIACEWLATFEDEVTSFPLGKHDDIVDALSQYLNWVRKEGMAFASSGQESCN